jgi:hypothetical protein
VKVALEALASPEEIAAITATLAALFEAADEPCPEPAPLSRWRLSSRVVEDDYDVARNCRLPRLRN